jgi:hypothetical protein
MTSGRCASSGVVSLESRCRTVCPCNRATALTRRACVSHVTASEAAGWFQLRPGHAKCPPPPPAPSGCFNLAKVLEMPPPDCSHQVLRGGYMSEFWPQGNSGWHYAGSNKPTTYPQMYGQHSHPLRFRVWTHHMLAHQLFMRAVIQHSTPQRVLQELNSVTATQDRYATETAMQRFSNKAHHSTRWLNPLSAADSVTVCRMLQISDITVLHHTLYFQIRIDLIPTPRSSSRETEAGVVHTQ